MQRWHCAEAQHAAGESQVGRPGLQPVIPLRQGVLPWGQRTLVMAVLNLTPDSFSDGGQVRVPAPAQLQPSGLRRVWSSASGVSLAYVESATGLQAAEQQHARRADGHASAAACPFAIAACCGGSPALSASPVCACPVAGQRAPAAEVQAARRADGDAGAAAGCCARCREAGRGRARRGGAVLPARVIPPGCRHRGWARAAPAAVRHTPGQRVQPACPRPGWVPRSSSGLSRLCTRDHCHHGWVHAAPAALSR